MGLGIKAFWPHFGAAVAWCVDAQQHLWRVWTQECSYSGHTGVYNSVLSGFSSRHPLRLFVHLPALLGDDSQTPTSLPLPPPLTGTNVVVSSEKFGAGVSGTGLGIFVP